MFALFGSLMLLGMTAHFFADMRSDSRADVARELAHVAFDSVAVYSSVTAMTGRGSEILLDRSGAPVAFFHDGHLDSLPVGNSDRTLC
jgi:hypothetical protein